MLHYGIPAYRSLRAELMKEIARIEAMGVTFRMNTRVDDLPEAMNARGFDTAFLAIAARVGHHLEIPTLDGPVDGSFPSARNGASMTSQAHRGADVGRY
jgi:formate dehydrogenase beta subunit